MFQGRHGRLCRIALAFLLVWLWTALPAYAGPNPVTATAAVSAPRLAPGESADVTVTIEIADGWHINAADPGLAFLIPTSLTFELPAAAKAGDVRFPQPETRRLQMAGDQPLHLYQGTVRLGAMISYAGGGTGEAVAVLKYQACNDTLCLRPVTLKLPLSLVFASRPESSSAGDGAGVAVAPARFNGCILAGMAFYFADGPPSKAL